jgi:protein TonB
VRSACRAAGFGWRGGWQIRPLFALQDCLRIPWRRAAEPARAKNLPAGTAEFDLIRAPGRHIMFEDSTFESNGKIQTRSRGWMVATLALNSAIVATLILIPLVHPEALPRMAMSFLVQVPPPPAPAPQSVARIAPVSSTAMPAPLAAPRRIPRTIFLSSTPDPAPSSPIAMLDSGSASGTPGGLGTAFQSSPAPRVVHPAAAPLRISSGVAASSILAQTLPVYPAIAKAAHVEGTVVLAASISKTGTVVNLRVVAGPPMLQQAALDAVQAWRYRPYTLNGDPVEVETTINVVFTMGR